MRNSLRVQKACLALCSKSLWRFSAVAIAITAVASASASVTYTYDELGRLKAVNFDNGSSVTYVLDAAGNRKLVASTVDTTALAAPTNLVATAISQSQINLSWAATDTTGSTLAGFQIFRNGALVHTTTTSATNFQDVGLSSFTTYSYTIASYDNATPANISLQSVPASAKTLDQTPPSVPGAPVATPISETQINLNWSASSDGQTGLAGYQVFRNGALVSTTGSNVTGFSDINLSACTSYSYSIAAFDGAIPANYSTQSPATGAKTLDQTPPTVPTSLSATATSQTQINLSWVGSTDSCSAVSYRIFRGGVPIGTTAVGALAFQDTSVSGFTTYTYTVAAVDSAAPTNNVSAQSVAASATTPDQTAPSVPSGLTATITGSPGISVNLSWAASVDTGGSGLLGYNILRNGIRIGGSNTPSYQDLGTASATTYTYTVQAFDRTPNTSAASAGLVVTTPVVPSNPTNLLPNGTLHALTWTETWTASTGPVDHYVLKQGNSGPTARTFTVVAPAHSVALSDTACEGDVIIVSACTSANVCSSGASAIVTTRCP